MHHPTDKIAHTTTFVTPVVEHWLEREIAQCVHYEGSIRRPIALILPIMYPLMLPLLRLQMPLLLVYCGSLCCDTMFTYYKVM